MAEESAATPALVRRFRIKTDVTVILAVAAFAVSVLNFYRNFIYTKQQLDVTVTEVSYVTNKGELYMTVAFANGGNREAALLRLEPALWARHGKPNSEWVPLVDNVDWNIPVTAPKMPTVIRGGGWRLSRYRRNWTRAMLKRPFSRRKAGRSSAFEWPR
jgi:hypothetical protein